MGHRLGEGEGIWVAGLGSAQHFEIVNLRKGDQEKLVQALVP